MKKQITVLMCLICMLMCSTTAMAATAINADGYYKGIKLCGKVKVMEHFADIKVKVVHSPDVLVILGQTFDFNRVLHLNLLSV